MKLQQLHMFASRTEINSLASLFCCDSWCLVKMKLFRIGMGERFRSNKDSGDELYDGELRELTEVRLFHVKKKSRYRLDFQSLRLNGLRPASLEVLLWCQLWLHAGSHHLLRLLCRCRSFFLAGQR